MRDAAIDVEAAAMELRVLLVELRAEADIVAHTLLQKMTDALGQDAPSKWSRLHAQDPLQSRKKRDTQLALARIRDSQSKSQSTRDLLLSSWHVDASALFASGYREYLTQTPNLNGVIRDSRIATRLCDPLLYTH